GGSRWTAPPVASSPRSADQVHLAVRDVLSHGTSSPIYVRAGPGPPQAAARTRSRAAFLEVHPCTSAIRCFVTSTVTSKTPYEPNTSSMRTGGEHSFDPAPCASLRRARRSSPAPERC